MPSDLIGVPDTVLIVDDNKANITLIAAILKRENIASHTATSGEKTLEILKEQEFSLIIMDVNMPGLTGFETADIIQKTKIACNTPIIFISSQCKSTANIEEGFSSGAYDYILRPIDIDLLRNKIKIFLRLHRTEQELKIANAALAKKAARLDHQLSEQLELNTALKFTEQVFENSVNGIIVVDNALRFIRVNKAFSDITGYSIDELAGKTPAMLSSGLQDKAFYETMWDTLNETGSWQGELWNKRKGSELYAELLSINAVKDKFGIVSNYIGIVSDITEKKKAHEKNERLANYDFLTGLPNRLKLMDSLQAMLATPKITQLALLFLDLDKFKAVNDSFGHQIGDDLLIAASKRLTGCIRKGDLVARLGGDEFIVILNNTHSDDSETTAQEVAKKIINAISSPFNITKQQLTINTSIGISLYPKHANTPDALITLSDNAMYLSKAEGPGHFHFCSDL